MKLLKGQRWRWSPPSTLFEIIDDSQPFDPKFALIIVNVTRVQGGEMMQVCFGKGYQKNWEYLEGQDKPTD